MSTAFIPGTFTRWPETDEELWWFIKTLFGGFGNQATKGQPESPEASNL